jgi:antitoxin FitA
MPTLTIRNVDVAIKQRLRVRAARNGRSMEAELRQILSDTLAPESGRQPYLAEAIRRALCPVGRRRPRPSPASAGRRAAEICRVIVLDTILLEPSRTIEPKTDWRRLAR